MLLLMTVLCLIALIVLNLQLLKLKKLTLRHDKLVSKDFDVITKYLLRLPIDEDFKDFNEDAKVWRADIKNLLFRLETDIEVARERVIAKIEQERLDLENFRSTRTNSTFKNLKAALASKGNEKDE